MRDAHLQASTHVYSWPGTESLLAEPASCLLTTSPKRAISPSIQAAAFCTHVQIYILIMKQEGVEGRAVVKALEQPSWG